MTSKVEAEGLCLIPEKRLCSGSDAPSVKLFPAPDQCEIAFRPRDNHTEEHIM